MPRKERSRLLATHLVAAVLVAPVFFPDEGTREFEVVQPPRIQLGDAPLEGFPGSETDQVEILWQNRRVGQPEVSDEFVVAVRKAGEEDFEEVGRPRKGGMQLGDDARSLASVVVRGLAYDTSYEYVVSHLQGDTLLDEYRGAFRTRLPPGDPTPFSFVAYGDSAYYDTTYRSLPDQRSRDEALQLLQGFRNVQRAINGTAAAFALLLGDNAYSAGSHAQYDGRFRADLCPEAVEWIRGHIDYPAVGNHDVGTQWGQPLRDSYSVPRPIAGVTAPASMPPGEYPEHHYSFDHGCAHFVTFDSNSRFDGEDPSSANPRLERQLDWLVADCKASAARWKFAFFHHHFAGTDHDQEGPHDVFFRRALARLNEAGVDVALVGHGHEYVRTYPLRAITEGRVVFDEDRDSSYAAGSGLVQVVAGVGGGNLRGSNRPFAELPFVAAGFSTTDSRSDVGTVSPEQRSEHGFVEVHVSPERLVFRYVGAVSGLTLDEFRIEAPDRVAPGDR